MRYLCQPRHPYVEILQVPIFFEELALSDELDALAALKEHEVGVGHIVANKECFLVEEARYSADAGQQVAGEFF